MFANKTIVIGITGGIAAYKIASLVSMLSKTEANVYVVMTENGSRFIGPAVFDSLTGNRTMIDTFDRNHPFSTEHVELAKAADLFLLAPATANTVAKVAAGLADNMLTTTFLAADCPKLVAPSMNTRMLQNPATQENLATLRRRGITVIPSASGHLACGDTGAGKMPEPEVLYGWICRELAREKDLAGKKVLITAGATQEPLDPVRFLTNHSTGKMGMALAQEAMWRGAEVTLVRAACTVPAPPFVQVVDVVTCADMFEAVSQRAAEQDILIKAAAVADYTPETVADEKIKKKDGDLSIPLKRTTDILSWLGAHRREGQYLCGFSMETENMVENSMAKLAKKGCDMIVANNLKEAGSGFGTDTNGVTLITAAGAEPLPMMSKGDVAGAIFDHILAAGV